MDRLPRELTFQILSWIDPIAIFKLCAVNKEFNACIRYTALCASAFFKLIRQLPHVLELALFYWPKNYRSVWISLIAKGLEAIDWGDEGDSLVLEAPIPPELCLLTNLKRLNLYDSGLTGEIPHEIGELVNLEYLCLTLNQLQGFIPSELYTIKRENRLTGGIDARIGELVNLTELSLSDNQLDGKIPDEIGRIVKLTSLHLGGNNLSGVIPDRCLFLCHNNLTGYVPRDFSRLVKLESINLTGTDLVVDPNLFSFWF
ncbi:hypothetical protein BDR26DRAFT_853907 [Obelidium mucronatum]|nr:hypothetical protein BDR26DRAFT_853907 [Obelidium mucronatum]